MSAPITTVAVIGLGRMGAAIAQRLVRGNFVVHGFDPSTAHAQAAAGHGVQVHTSIVDAVQDAELVWIMVPQGAAVDQVVEQVIPVVASGTILVDGGNSHFTDSVRRATQLKKNNLIFLDCGTSGGVHGLQHGFCLMVGGCTDGFVRASKVFAAIAAPQGCQHVGPSGAGHYVKMVHNGIEYALLQSYAEGLMVLKQGAYPDLDLAQITDVWQHGSVVRSWILELAHDVLKNDQKFTTVSGAIAENKTGQWTVDEARVHGVPVALIEQSLQIRAWSRQTGGNYATKLVALLRNAFGGHEVKKSE